MIRIIFALYLLGAVVDYLDSRMRLAIRPSRSLRLAIIWPLMFLASLYGRLIR